MATANAGAISKDKSDVTGAGGLVRLRKGVARAAARGVLWETAETHSGRSGLIRARPVVVVVEAGKDSRNLAPTALEARELLMCGHNAALAAAARGVPERA